MLVVVHNGNIELLFQTALNLEALGSLDILEVYTTEGRRDSLHGLYKFIGIFLVHLDIEYVDTCINLEEQTFTLHNGLAAKRAYISKAEHGCTIRDNGNEVTLVCIFICILLVFLDFKTGLGYSRRVGQTEVCLGEIGFCRNNFYLSGTFAGMIFKSLFFCNFSHLLM